MIRLNYGTEQAAFVSDIRYKQTPFKIIHHGIILAYKKYSHFGMHFGYNICALFPDFK